MDIDSLLTTLLTTCHNESDVIREISMYINRAPSIFDRVQTIGLIMDAAIKYIPIERIKAGGSVILYACLLEMKSNDTPKLRVLLPQWSFLPDDHLYAVFEVARSVPNSTYTVSDQPGPTESVPDDNTILAAQKELSEEECINLILRLFLLIDCVNELIDRNLLLTKGSNVPMQYVSAIDICRFVPPDVVTQWHQAISKFPELVKTQYQLVNAKRMDIPTLEKELTTVIPMFIMHP